jgi:hypothetical protein
MAEAQKQVVALLNRDHKDYSETFKGDMLTIPAGKAVKMSRRDAVQFRGQYGGSVEGDPTRPKVKNLIILPITEINPNLIAGELKDLTAPAAGVYICNYDGKEFGSQAELDAHLASIKSGHASRDESGNIVVGSEPEPLAEKDDMVSCPFCGKIGLKGAVGLQAHLRVCPKVKKDVTEEERQQVEEITA